MSSFSDVSGIRICDDEVCGDIVTPVILPEIADPIVLPEPELRLRFVKVKDGYFKECPDCEFYGETYDTHDVHICTEYTRLKSITEHNPIYFCGMRDYFACPKHYIEKDM